MWREHSPLYYCMTQRESLSSSFSWQKGILDLIKLACLVLLHYFILGLPSPNYLTELSGLQPPSQCILGSKLRATQKQTTLVALLNQVISQLLNGRGSVSCNNGLSVVCDKDGLGGLDDANTLSSLVKRLGECCASGE